MKPNRLLAVLALLLVAGCGHLSPERRAWEASWKAPQSVRVPGISIPVPLVKDGAGQLYLEVESRATKLFLNLDTGYPQPVLDRSFAQAHGIPCHSAKYKGKFRGGHFAFDMGILPELRIGTASAAGISAIFTDFPSRYAAVPGHGSRRVDGILGGALLPALRARIDFTRTCLSFGPVETPDDAVTVPLTKSDSGILLYVEMQFGTTNLLLMVDSGSTHTFLDASLMPRHGISALRVHGSASWIGASYPVKVGVVPEVKLGSLSIRGRRMSFLDLDSSGWRRDVESVAHRRVDGVLGTDLLSELAAIIDYGGDRLILTPPHAKNESE